MSARAGTFANPLSLLAGSEGSRARERRAPYATPHALPHAMAHAPAPGRRARGLRERGIALILAMTTVAILAVVLADMHESTSTSYALASTERDQLRAEYLARSGINLTRFLIAQEQPIRQAVTPLLQPLMGRPPGQIPVWRYASAILRPFCDYDGAQGMSAETGIDFSQAEGLGDTGGTCEVVGFSENSRINVNDPLNFDGDRARLNVTMQVYAMIGGYQSPSPFDPLFERRDADNQITTRLDIVSALVDWWDPDTQRTNFDPGAAAVTSSGAEDDLYGRLRDPYQVKNAAFDSIEELRLIRGVGDDFWATFLEPDPEDPESRLITIYGSGAVNPNEAAPEVLIARTCSVLVDQPLCTDVTEAAKFIQIMHTVRSLAPIPWFGRVEQYFQFLQGQGGPNDLYPMLQMMLGADNPLLFRPVTISPTAGQQLGAAFVTEARIVSLHSTGRVGNCRDDGEGVGRCTRVSIRSVLNFHEVWVPPPPNAGMMPRMGIFHYWRID